MYDKEKRLPSLFSDAESLRGVALADAIDYVRGLQGYPRWRFSEGEGSQAPPPKILQASSCLKHFFACEPKPTQSPHLCLTLML